MKIKHFHLKLSFVVGQLNICIFLLICRILLTCNYLFLYTSMFLIRSIQSNVSLLLDLPLFIPNREIKDVITALLIIWYIRWKQLLLLNYTYMNDLIWTAWKTLPTCGNSQNIVITNDREFRDMTRDFLFHVSNKCLNICFWKRFWIRARD